MKVTVKNEAMSVEGMTVAASRRGRIRAIEVRAGVERNDTEIKVSRRKNLRKKIEAAVTMLLVSRLTRKKVIQMKVFIASKAKGGSAIEVKVTVVIELNVLITMS